VAFAFDPQRKAILLVAGDKARERAEILSHTNQQGGQTVQQAFGPTGKRTQTKERKRIMATTLKGKMKTLDRNRRDKINKRAAELIAEELTLRDLRLARQKTQEHMAEVLQINQESVCRLEQRTDLLISTLRGYIEGTGGQLHLVAEFPDRPPVELAGFAATPLVPSAVAP
jgi:DNA-binding XRE family transcriptional regulator